MLLHTTKIILHACYWTRIQEWFGSKSNSKNIKFRIYYIYMR
jgi:hypothetical protein